MRGCIKRRSKGKALQDADHGQDKEKAFEAIWRIFMLKVHEGKAKGEKCLK